jgi:hypothetical protein
VAAVVDDGTLETERTLALVDLEEGVATPIEGSSVHPHYGFVAWSSAGDRVFTSGGSVAERLLLQYRLGDPNAVEIPVRVPAFYAMAAK